MNNYITECPVCNNKEFSKSGIILKEGELLVCDKCTQLVSQCSEEKYFKSMEEFNVSQGTLADNEKTLRRAYRVHSKRLIKCESLIDKKRDNIKLLDVGCSSGSFLKSAKEYGLTNISGVEPASKAAQTAIDSGFDVKIGFLEDINLESNCYDIITLFEVIEHLKEPKSLLSECHKILNKNGIFLISTGNANSWTVDIMKEKWDYFLKYGTKGTKDGFRVGEDLLPKLFIYQSIVPSIHSSKVCSGFHPNSFSIFDASIAYLLS